MTNAIMPVIVNGKSYLASEPTNPSRACEGCVAQCNAQLCMALPSCSHSFEGRNGIIFIDAHGPALPTEGVKVADEATHVALDKAIGHSHEYMRGHAAGVAAKQAEWDRWKDERAALKAQTMSAAYGVVRNSDPLTSQKAALDMNRKAGKIADLILVALRDFNLTGKQLAANTGVALNSITPRFAQLSRKGLIHAAGGKGRETVWAIGNGV